MGLADDSFGSSGMRLFEPHWIVAFYFPVFGPLRAVATPLLFLLLLLSLPAERRRLRFDPGSFLFFVAILLSTVFAENTGGVATPTLRSMTDSLVFFALSTHYIRDDRSLHHLPETLSGGICLLWTD